MKVRYSRGAQDDLAAISTYLRPRNPTAANTVVQAIEDRIAGLTYSPWMGPPTTIPGTRELIVRGYPYKIYYCVDGDEVRIIHIRHISRRPWGGEAG
ncbi:MAG: type II toxin-antitoxin system RelE/ParE family toxin [Variibacter sp.]|nr:type II toxin-antitoxin system RelE/ParE family toxin [Variibacter sp.]